jgi:hypothetical protein
MLERYYFLGDVMTLALALTWKCRAAGFSVRAVQLASVLSHIGYIHFHEKPWPALAGAICAAAALVVMGRLALPALNALVSEAAARLRPASGARTTS